LCTNNGESALEQMAKLYEQFPDCCIVAIQEVPIAEVNKYGVIDGQILNEMHNVYRVNHMVEKPNSDDAPSNLAIVGRYILIPEIFDVLGTTNPDKNGEIQITDALMQLAKLGKVIAYKFQGERFDCGTIKGFVDATNYFAKQENII